MKSYRDQIASELPGVQLLQPEIAVWEEKWFGSPNHLTRVGAVENSRQLGL